MIPIRLRNYWVPALLALAAACADGRNPAAPIATISDLPARPSIQALECVASVRSGTVSCGVASASGANRYLIGGQGNYVLIKSSNVTVANGVFDFDVTVQNLLTEQIGTADGVIVDPAGINVFLPSGVIVTAGTGTVTVENPDGMEALWDTSPPRPYFRYPQKLGPNEVSSPRKWRLAFDPGVTSFTFPLLVSTEVQRLLVINEVLANPGGSVLDATGEWFEIYNAGRLPVLLRGLLIADSSSIARRPYHTVVSADTIQPGASVVLGNTRDTTINGGVRVDYAYGSALSLVNSVDAIKVARLYRGDTLTIDRVSYASGAIAAKNGISRELKNPLLNNDNVDGTNWGDALSTAIYGLGGQGTPRAQNSIFTP